MASRQKILYLSIFITIAFAISIIYHILMGSVFHLGYPYNTFLFRPDNRFGDFLDNFNAGSNPYGEFKSYRAMFPFFMLLCRAMYLIDNKMILLDLYMAIFLCVLVVFILNYINQEPLYLRLFAVISLLFCSYPILISLDRANFENGVFLLVFLSVILIQKKYYIWASVSMGIAIAIKPYSIYFLPLFLIDAAITPFLLAGGIAFSLSIASLFILPIEIGNALNVLRTNLGLYNDTYVVGNEGLYFGTSIFGFLKIMIYWLGGVFNLFSSSEKVFGFIRSIMRPYFFVTILVFMGIIMILLFYKTSLWKKTAILASCVALLPYVGAAYRLLYFFIPLMLFLVEKKQEVKDRFYATIFGLIFIPTSYFHFIFNPIYLANPGEASDSILFHPIIITIFLASLIFDVTRQRELNGTFLALIKQFQNYFVHSKPGKKIV